MILNNLSSLNTINFILKSESIYTVNFIYSFVFFLQIVYKYLKICSLIRINFV